MAVAQTGLGHWVSSQRSAKRRLDSGEASPGITQARVDRLTALGMEWELQKSFAERCAELEAYKAEHGHCRVPFAPTGLGAWVSNQR